MPVHDWGAAYEDTFHDFALSWLIEQKAWLNRHSNGNGMYALLAPAFYHPSDPDFQKVRPRATAYIRRQHRVSVFESSSHRLVATIELPEAGLKKHPTWLRKFVRQRQKALADGIHSIVLDIAPNTPAAPQGIHPLIWEPYETTDLPVFPDRPLTLTSYAAGPEPTAYLEPLGIGSPLPDMPLFIAPDVYVGLPLEATYHAAWLGLPEHLRPTSDPPAGSFTSCRTTRNRARTSYAPRGLPPDERKPVVAVDEDAGDVPRRLTPSAGSVRS